MMNCVFQPLIEKMSDVDWKDCGPEPKNDFLTQTAVFSEELE